MELLPTQLTGRSIKAKFRACETAPQSPNFNHPTMAQPASRQLNVQQQNARTEAGLRATASYWRARGAPLPLAKIGEQMGVQWDRSIILSLDVDFPGMPAYFGSLLTHEERFIDFAIDSEGDSAQLEMWNDVSTRQNLCEHNRGTGAGYGALAVKILRELNAGNCATEPGQRPP